MGPGDTNESPKETALYREEESDMPRNDRTRFALHIGSKPRHLREPTDRLTGNSFTFIFYRSHIGTMPTKKVARIGRDGL